jgi:hypothetical protein
MFIRLTQMHIDEPISINVNHVHVICPYGTECRLVMGSNNGSSIYVKEPYDVVMALIMSETMPAKYS